MVAVRQQSWFSLPDVDVIVPDENYTALGNLRREDEGLLDVGYGDLCHRFAGKSHRPDRRSRTRTNEDAIKYAEKTFAFGVASTSPAGAER